MPRLVYFSLIQIFQQASPAFLHGSGESGGGAQGTCPPPLILGVKRRYDRREKSQQGK